MAWDPKSKGPLSSRHDVEEYSGDAPWDAFGGALGRIAERAQRKHDRLPTVSEVVAGFQRALLQAASGTPKKLLDPEAIDSRMAKWMNLTPVSAPKRQKAKTGDVLTIEYATGHSIYAHVLFAPTSRERREERGVGLGVCILILDRDVKDGDDLAEVILESPALFAPFHPNDALIREGTWRIVGNVPADPKKLPTFAVRVPDGNGGWRSILRDYSGNEIPSTPENRARVRAMSVGGDSFVRPAIRGARGIARAVYNLDQMGAEATG